MRSLITVVAMGMLATIATARGMSDSVAPPRPPPRPPTPPPPRPPSPPPWRGSHGDIVDGVAPPPNGGGGHHGNFFKRSDRLKLLARQIQALEEDELRARSAEPEFEDDVYAEFMARDVEEDDYFYF